MLSGSSAPRPPETRQPQPQQSQFELVIRKSHSVERVQIEPLVARSAQAGRCRRTSKGRCARGMRGVAREDRHSSAGRAIDDTQPPRPGQDPEQRDGEGERRRCERPRRAAPRLRAAAGSRAHRRHTAGASSPPRTPASATCAPKGRAARRRRRSRVGARSGAESTSSREAARARRLGAGRRPPPHPGICAEIVDGRICAGMADGTATGGPTRPRSEEVGYVELSRGGRELGAQRPLPRARSLLLAPKLVRSSAAPTRAAPLRLITT